MLSKMPSITFTALLYSKHVDFQLYGDVPIILSFQERLLGCSLSLSLSIRYLVLHFMLLTLPLLEISSSQPCIFPPPYAFLQDGSWISFGSFYQVGQSKQWKFETSRQRIGFSFLFCTPACYMITKINVHQKLRTMGQHSRNMSCSCDQSWLR